VPVTGRLLLTCGSGRAATSCTSAVTASAKAWHPSTEPALRMSSLWAALGRRDISRLPSLPWLTTADLRVTVARSVLPPAATAPLTLFAAPAVVCVRPWLWDDRGRQLRCGGARWRTRGSALDHLCLASETKACAVSFQRCSHILMLIFMVMCLCVINGAWRAARLSFISPWMRHRGSIMILLSSAKVSRHALQRVSILCGTCLRRS
jgi:hypothetical protein